MKIILSLLCVISLTSCGGFSGTLNVPLPERLGGGTIPITISK